jgi:hypothetical protein
MGFFKVIQKKKATGATDTAREKAESDMFEKVKDKFQGFDKDGNPVVLDNGEYSSFNAKEFKYLADKFKQANPNSQSGSYEEGFNKQQFQNLESQGNKFQGFDEKGSLIYRNEQGDLEDFGKQGGFAEFAKSKLADKKFSMANQGVANRVQDENQQLDPFSQRSGMGAIKSVNKAGSLIANPQNAGSENIQSQPQASGNSLESKFYQSQMERQAQERNKLAAQEKAKAQKAAQPQQAPSLTGMAASFAQQQAQKQATPVLNQADAQARQAAQPYVQQGQQVKNQVGQQVQQATGINPYSSIQNQAVNKAAEMTGVDSGLLGQGVAALANPQQAITNLAKQQVASNLTNAITGNTGADAGVTSSLVNTLVGGGNLGQAATSLATDKAKTMALDYAKKQLGNTAVGSMLNMVPGGVGSAMQIGKALFSGGSTEDRGRAASQAAARAAAAAATGGLSEVINPETLQMGASGLTNIKDSKTLNRMGVAGDAIKGATGIASGSMNAVADVGNIGLKSVGNTGASTARQLKGATEGLKSITQGNIGSGLGQLGSSIGQGIIDTFIKNPVDTAGNIVKFLGGAAGKVGNAVEDALEWICFDPETEIIMADNSIKKAKDIKVGDDLLIGGKVNGTGEAVAKEMIDYNGVLVSATHAVFEDGVWVRAKDSKQGKKTDLQNHVVIPIANKDHVVITKDFQVWADISEIDDTQDYSDVERLEKMNSQKNKNRLLKVFMNAHKKI